MRPRPPRTGRRPRVYHEGLAPHATGGVYVNFVDGDEGEDRVRAAYGDETYERLAAVEAEWDPENVFHPNRSVDPADAPEV